jgi:hypothetical protein
MVVGAHPGEGVARAGGGVRGALRRVRPVRADRPSCRNLQGRDASAVHPPDRGRSGGEAPRHRPGAGAGGGRKQLSWVSSGSRSIPGASTQPPRRSSRGADTRSTTSACGAVCHPPAIGRVCKQGASDVCPERPDPREHHLPRRLPSWHDRVGAGAFGDPCRSTAIRLVGATRRRRRTSPRPARTTPGR